MQNLGSFLGGEEAHPLKKMNVHVKYRVLLSEFLSEPSPEVLIWWMLKMYFREV